MAEVTGPSVKLLDTKLGRNTLFSGGCGHSSSTALRESEHDFEKEVVTFKDLNKTGGK